MTFIIVRNWALKKIQFPKHLNVHSILFLIFFGNFYYGTWKWWCNNGGILNFMNLMLLNNWQQQWILYDGLRWSMKMNRILIISKGKIQTPIEKKNNVRSDYESFLLNFSTFIENSYISVWTTNFFFSSW